jgi:hypothetical protein
MFWSGEWARGRELRAISSEAEIRPRGRPTLVSPEGASGPRARQKFARGAPRLAARWAAEVIWAVGSSPHQAVIMRGVIYGLWVRLCLLFCEKRGFSLVIRGPSWLSR